MKATGFVILSGVLLCMGCSGGESEKDHDAPRRMFEELCSLTKAYTDSMKHVTDSASFMELSDRYEEKYAAISFKYPPGTDNELTEGENDRLYSLAKAYIKARESALKVAPCDTIPADSIVPPPVKEESER